MCGKTQRKLLIINEGILITYSADLTTKSHNNIGMFCHNLYLDYNFEFALLETNSKYRFIIWRNNSRKFCLKFVKGTNRMLVIFWDKNIVQRTKPVYIIRHYLCSKLETNYIFIQFWESQHYFDSIELNYVHLTNEIT